MFKEDISQCCMNCERLARELAQQAELLRRAKDILQEGCNLLAWPNTDLMTVKIKAQTLLPDIKKALEKVK